MTFSKKIMTRGWCIEILRANMDLIIFDPATGERQEPEYLSEENRVIYDALAYAANFLEQRPREGRYSYFFTFGSDPEFPFGIDDYVEVHADSQLQARKKFKSHYPNRGGSGLINCTAVYTESQWEDVGERFYGGKSPIRVID